MAEFEPFHHHEVPAEEADAAGLLSSSADRLARIREFGQSEVAARLYLDAALRTDRDRFAHLLASEAATLVPSVELVDVLRSPFDSNQIVRFRQLQRGVPVFGSRVVVELDPRYALVAIDMQTARIERDPFALVSPEGALAYLRDAHSDVDRSTARAPELVFFGTDEGTFQLAYFISDALTDPFDSDAKPTDHQLDTVPPDTYHVVIDADNGRVLLAYPANPTLDLPAICRGLDDLGVPQRFNGRAATGGFEMSDPDRDIITCDLAYADFSTASPSTAPVCEPSADFAALRRAAVSAHFNATRVHDFYESFLHRDGVDGKGMTLRSFVNCTRAGLRNYPVWRNAQWRTDHMVFGQRQLPDGSYQSIATFLDATAHELTHGVNAATAGLVYRNQSGALDESLADIMAVIINNWYVQGGSADVDTWDWAIGQGLGAGGGPLRDVSQPQLSGCPDHMSGYLYTSQDYGGVHTNCAIHTLAAVNLLRAKDQATNERQFSATEVAGLYHKVIQLLASQATFADARATLVNVVSTMFAGFPADQAAKIHAVEDAYDDVGIF